MHAAIAKECAKLWWTKKPRIDAEIRIRFEQTLLAASRDELDSWRDSPEGLLALILVTDQFPRNMYRSTPKSFKYDELARSLCWDALCTGADWQLRPIERVFMYLPLEHSESLDDQNKCVRLYSALLYETDDRHRDVFQRFLDYAVRHQKVIERFGRFPHRNIILGRKTTAEEFEFLKQPGSSF